MTSELFNNIGHFKSPLLKPHWPRRTSLSDQRMEKVYDPQTILTLVSVKQHPSFYVPI